MEPYIWGIIAAVFILMIVICKFQVLSSKNPHFPDLTGKVIIITGANIGLGLESAKQLANLNATIIMACRSESKAQAAIVDIKLISTKVASNLNISFIQLDLNDLNSVKKFVIEFKTKFQKLDVLLNNAGLFTASNKLTSQGFEICFGVNHLGPYLLTELLLDVLAEDGRVVNLSSKAHTSAKITVDNLKQEQLEVQEFVRYANSKKCNVFFNTWLAKKFEGTTQTSYACHPGGVRTNIFETLLPTNCCKKFMFYATAPLWYPLWLLVTQTVWRGAQTQIYLCVAPKDELVSGGYYDNCLIGQIIKKEGYYEHYDQIMELSQEYTKEYRLLKEMELLIE